MSTLACGLLEPCLAGPVIVQERRIALEVEVILVGTEGGSSLGSHPLEVSAKAGDKMETPVPWPESGGGPGTLRLEASEGGTAETTPIVHLDAVLTLRSERVIRASRDATLVDGGTTLFEVFEERGERLVLSIKGERVSRPVVRESSGATARVRFRLVVERIDGDRTVPLETNELSSFLGEGVEYSFARGAGDSAESLRLVLTLQRLDGDLAEVVADVSASLPGPAGPILMSRQDRVFATRGATSTVEAVSGEPPAGYRFRITPLF